MNLDKMAVRTEVDPSALYYILEGLDTWDEYK